MGKNDPVTNTSGGRRAGSRRGVRPKRRFRPDVFFYCLGIVALLVVWGILVGQAVGAGGDRSWGKLVITALIAVVCLFASFTLIGRLWRKLTAEPERPAEPPAAAPPRSQPAERAYVEDQSFFDPGGYSAPGSDAYGAYDNPYADPYADPYGDGGADPYNAGTKRPSYGVGNNRLPRRQSLPQPPAYDQPPGPPPSSPPPAQPPGGQGSGRHSGHQSPSDSWAPPAADHGTSSGEYYDIGAYDYGTGSYDTGSYDTGSYGSRAYDTGAYEIGGYNWSTGTYNGDPEPGYAAYEPGPATQSMPAPAQRAPQLPAQRDDDTWPPEPPRYRH